MRAAVNDGAVARQYLARTEDLIADQKGRTVEDIRPSVASALKITASAVHLIRRGRRKEIPSWLMDKIVGLFIETAQNEMRALEHEIEVARRLGLDHRDGTISAAKARAAAILRVLESVSSEGSIGGQR